MTAIRTNPCRALALAALAAAVAVLGPAPVSAGPAQERLIAAYAAEAKAQGMLDGGTLADGFSAARGQAFFLARPASGKPETPSCTACHTSSPANPGRTRAGKAIEPMALSKTPDRYSDPAKVEKWFRRNCRSVLGRPCTAQEKGDFLAFMTAQ